MLNEARLVFHRMQSRFRDRWNVKQPAKVNARSGSQSTTHKVLWVAGASLVAFILDEMHQELFVDKVDPSFISEVGKLWLWFMFLASVCYMGSQCGKRKHRFFQSKRTERKESSNHKQSDFAKHSQHMKMLAAKSDQGVTRSAEPVACRKQVQLTQATAEKHLQILHKKESIRMAVKIGDAKTAAQLLHEIFDAGFLPDVRICNFVINGCAKTGDVACAETWFMKMRYMGVAPNKTSYNMLMDACVKADNVAAAKRWFDQMVHDGQVPDEVSYATMIHAHAKHGAAEQAEAWLQRMQDAGVEPNVVTYNSLILACSRNGDLAGAEKWAYKAEEADIAAGVTDHTGVVNASCDNGDESPAEKQLEKLNSSKTEPNVVTYSSMIDACAKVGDRAGAERWHMRMVERGLQPNAHTFSSVITACAKAGDAVAASQYLKIMEEETQIAPDVVVYGSVLNACARAGDVERAKKIFQQMKSLGIHPNAFAYSLMAQTFAYRGDWLEVEKLEKKMIEAGYSVNEHFLCARLLSYARAWPRQSQRAEATFLDARAKGIPVNKHILGALRRAVGAPRCKQLASGEDALPQQVPPPQQHQQTPAGAQQGSTVQNSVQVKGPKPSSTAVTYVKAGAR